MKKKLSIIILLALFGLTGKAQKFFEAGIKAGINNSKLATSISDYNSQTINNYLFGAFARLNFSRIYIQPEAYYNSKAGEVIEKVDLTTINSFDYKTLDVPVLLGLKIIDQKAFNLRIMGGPVFSFVTDKSAGVSEFNVDYIKNNFFGWQYGAGVDFLFLTFDARMQSLSSSIYEAPDFSTKNGNFVVSLGIKLF
jgi:hypothetical protein